MPDPASRLLAAAPRPIVRVVPVLITAAVTLFASAASAQTPPPSQTPPRVTEHLVVTATHAPTSLDALGRGVVVLFREDLDRLGVTSIVTALRLVPGLDVRARGPHDVQTDVSIRGATFGQNLVLVDGFRLNDAQSGHHNGEIPLPLVGLSRVEIAAGGGSAVHGADALGGVINVISRTDPHLAADVAGGRHGFASAQISMSGHGLPAGWTIAGWGSRSGGFTFDRDFAQGGASLRVQPRQALSIDLHHQRRAFGANGSYGPSPSKEWTDQTLAGVRWSTTAGAWIARLRALYRNHGDHFRWDIARPGFAENRHRTDAAEAGVLLERTAGAQRLHLGGGGSGDWIASSNLGDHRYAHAYAFTELQSPLGSRASLQAALRADRYSVFGSAVTPSVAVHLRLTDTVRIRGNVGRAFRIPTFTERYYRDPAHFAQAALRPERSWSADAGLDVGRAAWSAGVTPFVRWDADIIDWVRDTPADLWQTTNVRDVKTTGAEFHAQWRFSRGLVRLHYTAIDVDAPQLTQLSKYLLEYARHAAGAATVVTLRGNISLSATVDHRRRFGGVPYTLVGVRLGRRIGPADLYLDATNLLDTDYVEIPGVAMPGRWVMAGVAIR